MMNIENMTFKEWKHKTEMDNAIPLMSDNQEWVAKDAWDFQQDKIDKLEARNKVLEVQIVNLQNKVKKKYYSGMPREVRKEIDKLKARNEVLEEENKRINKLNSYTRGSLNRVCSDVSNGEHISKEWIEQTIIEYCDDKMRSAYNSKIDKLEARNKVLEGVREFYADPSHWDVYYTSQLIEEDESRVSKGALFQCGGKRAREAAE